MGKASRTKRRHTSQAGASFFRGTPPAADRGDLLHELAYQALTAVDAGDLRLLVELLPRITGAEFVGHEQVLDAYVVRVLKASVTEAWQHGWQPDDVVRVIGRRQSSQHVAQVKDAIADEMSGYAATTVDPRWQAQLAEAGVRRWWPASTSYLRANPDYSRSRATLVLMMLELIVTVSRLPKVELHLPVPGAATTAAVQLTGSVDERTLSKIRTMLAKAESTQYEAEAETFTAAAQKLMAKHSIDAALLQATRPEQRTGPAGLRIGLDNPYEGAKVALLNAVSGANRCRTIWSKELYFATVVGFPPDLVAVESLYTSLLVQATAALARVGSVSGAGSRSRSRSFRQSFLTAYAYRIGERLSEVTEAEVRQAAAATEGGDERLLPVLASRAEAVDDAVDAIFPNLRMSAGSNVTDGAGWAAGQSAADLARLGGGGEVTG